MGTHIITKAPRHLTKQEIRILAILRENAGMIVPDADLHFSYSALRSAIKRLRRKVPDKIVRFSGRGYSLNPTGAGIEALDGLVDNRDPAQVVWR